LDAAAAERFPKFGVKGLTRQGLGFLRRAAMGMDVQRIQEATDEAERSAAKAA
jgi:hypothetical protein